MKKNYILLGIILFIGIFLRFYQLGNVPVGFHRDEAFFGYNAYSLLKTGKDMSGISFPIHLTSFLYSPAGYSYAVVPFIAIFGLTEFAVRFPSAIFGCATILLTYFLVKELFGKKSEFLALSSAFFLAITPWHINLSRTATENVLVVFFIGLGVLFYSRWVKNNNLFFILGSFFSFGIPLLLYQSPRAFLPFFLPFLFLIFLGKAYKKWVLSLLLYGIVIVIPVLLILHSPQLSTRMRMLSILQNGDAQLRLNEQIREDGVMHTPLTTTRILHNKVTMYSSVFLENYFAHFSYNLLFTDEGYPRRYAIPSMGLLYIFDLPLLMYGTWKILHNNKKMGIFLLGWTFLTPIGSALTFDDIPNLQRTLMIFPALSILSGFGISSCIQLLKAHIKMRVVYLSILTFLTLLVCFNVGFYFHQYFVQSIIHRPWNRQEGYKSLVQTVNKYAQYKKIEVTQSLSAPSIFFLFYNHYDPILYQKLVKNKGIFAIDYNNVSFGKYYFSPDACPLTITSIPISAAIPKLTTVTGDSDTLYVDTANCDINSNHIHVVKDITRTDGTTIFRLVTYIP